MVESGAEGRDGQGRIGGRAAYVIGLLLLVNMMNYGQRMLPATLLPFIKADIGLSDTELGLLMGGAFGICYALGAIPLARVAERVGRRSWLAGSLAVWSTITAATGYAQGFAHLMVARLGMGLAEAPAIPCSHAIIADHVPAERRAFAFSIHSLGGVAGVAGMLVAGGYLGSAIGWRGAFVLMGLPGVGLALLLYLTLHDRPRAAGTPATSIKPAPGAIRELLSEPFFGFVLLAICVSTIVEFGLNQWLPTFYVREYGLSVEAVGYRYGMAVAIGGILGSLTGAFATDQLVRRDRRWLVWMPASAYALAVPTGLGMLLAHEASTAFLLNGIYGFLVYSTSGAMWAACMVLAPADMRATASAMALTLSGLTGLTLGPIVVGLLSDGLALAYGRASLRVALVAIELSALLVVASLLMAGWMLTRRAPAILSPSH